MQAPHLFLLVATFFCSTLFAQTNPLPFLNQPLVPDSAVPGAEGFTLTVNGTGFVSGASVNWNDNPRSTTFVSSSQLQAVIPASDIVTPQTAHITVTNPSPGGGVSAAANFQVTIPAPSAYFLTENIDLGAYTGEGFVFAGDFNGDNKQDLVYWLSGPGVVVQLGNGNGSFRKAKVVSPYGVPSNPVDVNGDGKLDLVLSDSPHNEVVIMLGNGDGTFQSPKRFIVGNGNCSPVTGDFNGDGKLDIAVANSDDNTISILLGNGDGTFRPQILVSGLGELPSALAVGDFNRDGKLDLAVGMINVEFFSILLGNGDGTFTIEQNIPVVTTLTFGIMAVDFNNDGNLDVIVNDDYLPEVFIGNGDGTFQAGSVLPGMDGFSFSAGDMNADGKLDWVGTVVTGAESGGVTVNIGNGDGTFPSRYRYPIRSSFPSQGDGAVVADFNNDGKLDVVTVNYGGSTAWMTILLQSSAVLTPNVVGFGYTPVGHKAIRTVTLTNAHPSPLKIYGFKINGKNAADFRQSNNCPTTLPPGMSCTVQVVFRPSIQGQRESASLQVSDSGSKGRQTTRLYGRSTQLTTKPD